MRLIRDWSGDVAFRQISPVRVISSKSAPQTTDNFPHGSGWSSSRMAMDTPRGGGLAKFALASCQTFFVRSSRRQRLGHNASGKLRIEEGCVALPGLPEVDLRNWESLPNREFTNQLGDALGGRIRIQQVQGFTQLA